MKTTKQFKTKFKIARYETGQWKQVGSDLLFNGVKLECRWKPDVYYKSAGRHSMALVDQFGFAHQWQ